MNLRVLIKLPLTALAITCFLVQSFIIHLVTRDPLKRRRRFTRNGKAWASVALKALGVKAKFINLPTGQKRHLIIANHMGYLDVIVLLSEMDAVFVTSQEMRETPVLGLLSEMGGALFIERRSRLNIKNEIKTVAETLKGGFDVVIFPEGTSSSGEEILPFKKSFLVACAGTDASLMPTVINFRRVNGEPMSHKWRDYVTWYGDQTFVPSLLRLLSLKSVEVEVKFLEEIHVHSEDDRKHVAEQAQKQIEAAFDPILSPAKGSEEMMAPSDKKACTS